VVLRRDRCPRSKRLQVIGSREEQPDMMGRVGYENKLYKLQVKAGHTRVRDVHLNLEFSACPSTICIYIPKSLSSYNIDEIRKY
jgi:hypothetical protein